MSGTLRTWCSWHLELAKQTSEGLNDEEQKVAAIQSWEGQQIDHAQVDVHNGCKLEEAGEIGFGHITPRLDDGHWARYRVLGLVKVQEDLRQACNRQAGKHHVQHQQPYHWNHKAPLCRLKAHSVFDH